MTRRRPPGRTTVRVLVLIGLALTLISLFIVIH